MVEIIGMYQPRTRTLVSVLVQRAISVHDYAGLTANESSTVASVTIGSSPVFFALANEIIVLRTVVVEVYYGDRFAVAISAFLFAVVGNVFDSVFRGDVCGDEVVESVAFRRVRKK